MIFGKKKPPVPSDPEPATDREGAATFNGGPDGPQDRPPRAAGTIYTRKAIDVEAMRLPEGGEMSEKLMSWLLAAAPEKIVIHESGAVDILTCEGWRVAEPGDVIVFELDGEVYPMDLVRFRANFERKQE